MSQMKYKVKKKLRQMPGNVTVYEADQKDLHRKVEVRVFDKFVGRDSDTYLRFEREFKTIARLDHPNVVKVYDWGLAEDKIYYVAERREAAPLEEFTGDKALSAQQILDIGVQIADALAYLHEQSLVHRDVGLQSIYFAPDKKIAYVAHFTMVKNLNLEDLTAKGVAQVAPLAFTPERLQQKEIDTRTDVFLLGAALYEMLTGAQPLPREQVLINPGGTYEVRTPSEIEPSLDERVDAVLLKALAWDPQERYADAASFQKDLEEVRDKMVSRAGRRPGPAPAAAESGAELEASSVPPSGAGKGGSSASLSAAAPQGPGEAQLRGMGMGALVDAVGAVGAWAVLGGGGLVILVVLWLLL